MAENRTPQVVVLGAGFGGLTFCQHFRHPTARVTLVDRTNHHLFQPLLYQVATAGLSAPEIAQPVRAILANRPNVSVLLDTVVDFSLVSRQVLLSRRALSYDYLVLALGGCTAYFGHPEWEQFAPGLKTLEDALRIRSQVLLAFERAEDASDQAERDKLMTIVVVGGGPTGLELAGAFAELTRTVLKSDFRRIDPSQARIILIEAGPRVLAHFPEDLSASALRQLEHLGVQVRTSTHVKAIRQGEVELASGEIIRAENILWAAGVSAVPLTQKLGVELDRAGRVKVNPDLSLPGHPDVFAVGDMALVLDGKGQPVPGVSPAAMQMARHVAGIIKTELDNEQTNSSIGAGTARPRVPQTEWESAGTSRPRPDHSGRLSPPQNNESGHAARPAFKYWDRGTMATIGRSAAVAWIGRLHFSGLLAWLTWLLVHLIFLIGFRNRLAVLLQWTYSYFTYKRGARIITNLPPPPGAADEVGD